MIRDRIDSTPVIDLTGPQGNAYALMALASRYARQLGLDSDAVLAEMQQGDYENLVQVFDRYFGEYVILER
jgi:DNA-directed RNA polymerase subunit K/omega